jgi:hypothetical protein
MSATSMQATPANPAIGTLIALLLTKANPSGISGEQESRKSRKMKHFVTIAAAAFLFAGISSSALAGSCPEDLPRTLGYWKTHSEMWPISYVVVGNNQLGMDYIIENVAPLEASPQGDAVVILLHQLIPAKLNIAGGVNGAPVQSYIDDADALIAQYWIGDYMDKDTREEMVELAERLDEFNNGAYCELPVELTAFEATTDGTLVSLSWITASESNNAGFEIEHRRGDGYGFESVSFVAGYGTTNSENRYSAQLSDLGFGRHTFRLKQIDLDGTFSYSAAVEVETSLTNSFALTNAYPNPFNPTTNIRFSLRESGNVSLAVFDVAGRHVKTLASGVFEAGSHDVTFSADNLPSGTYLYRLQTPAGPVSGSLVLLK